MFLGIGQFGNLINPAAISMLNANAYQAAKQVLGPNTSSEVLFKAADDFVKFVIPKTNRALTVFEMVHDINFKRIADAAKESAAPKSSHDALVDVSDYSLSGSMFGGIPNYLVYGGVAALGYWYWKKKHKGAAPIASAAAVPTGATV